MDTIKPAIKAIKELSEEATVELEKFKRSKNLPELCRLFKELKESIELIEELTKTISSVKEELSTTILPSLFEDNEVDELKTSNRKFSYGAKLYTSIKAGMHEKAHEFLRKIGYEAAIKEGIHPQTLNTCIREYNAQNGTLPPDDIFHTFIKKEVSVRKVRS